MIGLSLAWTAAFALLGLAVHGQASAASSPRPSTAAGRSVTIRKHSAISAGEVSWVACAPTKATWTGLPVPSGYQGSMMSSWPNATLMPAASISLTLVSPRRFG
jgi:hypothetical protein